MRSTGFRHLTTRALVAAASILVALFAVTQPSYADANSFDGATVNLTYYVPSTTVVAENNGDAVVGAGVEFTDVLAVFSPMGAAFDVDVEGYKITLTHTRDTTYDPNIFSGPIIAVVAGAPDPDNAIYNVADSTAATTPGVFIPGLVDHAVAINLQGKTYTTGEVIVVDVFFDETVLPTVAAITPSLDPVTDGDVGASAFTLTVDFSEKMDTTVAPTLTFPTEDATGTLSFASGSWTDDDTYVAVYDVADANDVLPNVDVRVAAATDWNGNVMTAATTADVFDIDMPGGEIVIEKSVIGGDGSFDFTSAEAALTFTLNTAGGTASQSVTNLAPGVYQVSEVVHPDYMLTNIVCVDPDSGSSVNLGAGTATIDLDNKETVTCTFTNAEDASITIQQSVSGDDGTFDYSGTLGAFSIATAGGAGSQTFDDLAAGIYSVSLAALTGYTTTDLSCTGDLDSGSSIDVAGGSVDIDLDVGETIVCTFESTENPSIDVGALLSLPLTLAKEITDPSLVAAAVELNNPGGAPLSFSVAESVDWLAVTPETGSIPAGGATNLMFQLTAAAGELDTGSYTADVTISATGVGDPESAVVTVELEVEETDGTITIIATTAPALAGDATFTYQSGDAQLAALSLSTIDGAAVSQAFVKRLGVYTLTQAELEEWRVDSISCIGDTDGGTVIDAATRSVQIDLDPDEAIVCTFANVRDEDHVRRVTQRVIRSFMAERADRILSTAPKLSDRLRARGGSAGGLQTDTADGRFNFNMSASLSGLRRANQERERVKLASADGIVASDADLAPEGRGWRDTLDVWVQATFESVDSNRSGLDEDADFGVVYVGADVLTSERMLVGGIVQVDIMDTTSGELGSKVDGVGWMAGPYFVRRIADNVYLDGRAAVGGSRNDVNPFGLYTDEFTTRRRMVEANLTGDYKFDAWRVRPSIGVAYFHERQNDYVDSLGIEIPFQEISIGRVRAGPEVAYRFERGDGSFVEPFGELSMVWDYKPATVYDAVGVSRQHEDLRAAGRFGVAARFRNGGVLAAALRVDGIGDEDFSATGAEVRVNVPFN